MLTLVYLESYEDHKHEKIRQKRSDFILTFYLDAGEVTVHNTATKKDGSFDEIYGTAYVPDPNYPGELLVDFPGGSLHYFLLLQKVIFLTKR